MAFNSNASLNLYVMEHNTFDVEWYAIFLINGYFGISIYGMESQSPAFPCTFGRLLHENITWTDKPWEEQ